MTLSRNTSTSTFPQAITDTADPGTEDIVEQIGVERSKSPQGSRSCPPRPQCQRTPQDRQLLEISQDSNRIILLNKVDLPEKTERPQLPEDHIKISVLKTQTSIKLKTGSMPFFKNATG